MFIYSDYQVENEEEADDELILVGLEVREPTEDEESLSIRTSQWAHFPAPNSTVTGGTNHVVLIPDSGLSSLYGDSRVTVHHEMAKVAEFLLQGNFLPPVIFGRDSDIDIRQRVFDEVGLTDTGISDDNTAYRKALREIAGLDSDDVAESPDETEAERLKNEYKYTELKSMASDAGIENANVKKDDLAEYLASTDADY